MKKAIMPYAAKALSSDELLHIKRRFLGLKREMFNKTAKLDVYLKIDDPYSYLLVQVLEFLHDRFSIEFQFHVYQDIDPDMFPKLEMWKAHTFHDAKALASLYKLDFPKQPLTRDHQTNQRYSTALVNLEDSSQFLKQANELFQSYWLGDTLRHQLNEKQTDLALKKLKANANLLKKRGHYLGAMIHFEGEWYWGIDRLDHLENRLIETGLAKHEEEIIFFDRTYRDFCQTSLPETINHQKIQPLTLFWSARSPYSYIGLERTIKLARHYQIPLDIKPVLPMMMRGLPVPDTKKMYIFHDTKREAKKLGLPYGFVADPLGAAVERCYSLVNYARNENRLEDFLLSFARGVNAEGIRAETDQGLKTIVERCGLNWSTAKKLLADRSWEKWAEENLEEMLSLGVWGVPCIVYGKHHFWGQDRIGMVEQLILNDLKVS